MSRALRRALQALAQVAPVQRALFPEFQSAGDEVARVFERAVRESELGVEEAAHAARIEACFIEHGGQGHADFWDDLDDPRWEELRNLAHQMLITFGFPVSKPSPYDP